MAAQGQAHRHVILDDLFALGHLGQADGGLHDPLAVQITRKQRQFLFRAQRTRGPERVAAAEPKNGEGIRLGQNGQRLRVNPGAPPHILDRAVAVATGGGDPVGLVLAQGSDLPEPQAQRQVPGFGPLHHVVPLAAVDADRAHLHPVFAGIAHDLGGGVEPHGLRIQQRAGEDAGVVVFQPGRCIDQQREGRRVAFGKTVGPEPFDLRKAPLGEIIVIAIGPHPAQKPGAEFADGPMFLEGRQRPAQPVRLIRGETRACDRDLHRLFLKQRHAERLAQHAAKGVGGEADLLLPVPSADERMDHVALDRAGPDDGDLDHQVIETARPHSGQEIHLRPAFDLEHPQAVGFAQHVIDARVLGRQRGEGIIDLMVQIQQAEGFPDTGQHAERQHIDLQDTQRVDIVLVPTDDGAVLHRGVLDRHQFIEPPLGDHEPADMLAEMAGKADDLLDQVDGLGQARAVGVEADLAHPRDLGPGFRP